MSNSKIELIPTQYTGRNKYGDYDYMIKQPNYDDSLFIFNDNEEAYLTKYKIKGGGNAIIRPYRYSNPPRAAGIPTGTRKSRDQGYKVLDAKTKNVIDAAIKDIKTLLDTGKYKRVFYSAGKDGGLGTAIFVVCEDVKVYIVDELRKLTSYVC